MLPSTRMAPIDALRGIAALLVVWQHTSESFVLLPGVAAKGSLLADVAGTFDVGRIGIICFFLISGFVIPSSFNKSKSNPIKSFVIRRFFRLFPAYWLSLLLIVLVGMLWGKGIGASTVLANTTMLQGFLGEPHLIGLYWTLQVELVFYVFCVLLFYFGLLQNDKVVFGLIIFFFALFVVGQGAIHLYGEFTFMSKEFQIMPYLISIMFLGSLYRKMYDLKQTDKRLKLFTLLGTICCLGLPVLLLVLSLSGFELIENSFRFGLGQSFGFLMFFLGLYFLKNVPKFLLYLGVISYSVYLLHPVILQVMVYTLSLPSFELLLGLHLSVYMVAAMILTIGFSFLVYVCLEKPMVNLAYKITAYS
ncbi:MAG: acyltransferase [Proteobacteria bacterium]|nr:acyltransferase [Pseudomonadota bacterium]